MKMVNEGNKIIKARSLDEIYAETDFPFVMDDDNIYTEREFEEMLKKPYFGSFIPGACYNLLAERADYSRHFQDNAQKILISPRCGRQVPLMNCVYIRDDKNILSEYPFHFFTFIYGRDLYRIRYNSEFDKNFEVSLSPSKLNIIPEVIIRYIEPDLPHLKEVNLFLEEARLLVSEENRKRRLSLPKGSKESFLSCGTLMGYNLPIEIKEIIMNYK